jgi:alpha-glucosidase
MFQDHLGRSVATQVAEPASILHFYRQFLAWRKRSEALRRGTIHFYQTPEPILALRRELGADRILAVFNLSSAPVHYTLPGQVQPLTGHGLDTGSLDGRELHLPPWGGFFGRMT